MSVCSGDNLWNKIMTMAENHTNGPIVDPHSKNTNQQYQYQQQQQHQQNEHQENCVSNSGRSDPKKRKRKRLLAVLDKLHNNTNISPPSTTNTNLNNNNTFSVNNNLLTATAHAMPSINDDKQMTYSTNLNRSVEQNAEILRNLFALSRSMNFPHHLSNFPATNHIHQLSPSPVTMKLECNNNNNNNNDNDVNGKMMVKIEIKEELMEQEEASTTTSTEEEEECIDGGADEEIRNNKVTPLQEYMYMLPKTMDNKNQQHKKYNHQKQQLKNGIFHEPQEQPLDLSMKKKQQKQPRRKSNMSNCSNSSSPNLTKQLLMQQAEKHLVAALHPIGIQVPRDCSISIQTSNNELSPHQYHHHQHQQLPQYYNDMKVSPIVEEVAPGSNNIAYVCPICGQMFSLNDRLAKHIASRHKTRSPASESTKSYVCEVCDRSFARSDMLTRHMRLHTGIKPYTCLTCGQVFSRSDHLSTHQRTHTGEKPYRCPQCNYAACRRDMITRHMRTHARYEQNHGNQPPRKVVKMETAAKKNSRMPNMLASNVEQQTLTNNNNNNNNNDSSMFNQNNLDKINELRVKIQENMIANNNLGVVNTLGSENMLNEIKIEF